MADEKKTAIVVYGIEAWTGTTSTTAPVYAPQLPAVAPVAAPEARATEIVRMPGPLVMGKGSLAPMFGRTFRKRGAGRRAPASQGHGSRNGATVSRIELHSEKRQLSLWSPSLVQLVNPLAMRS
jgi:hypothetical protein